MKNINTNAVTNKKNAGKGNGNSIISHKSPEYKADDYVSGDEFPTSSGHKFSKNTQNIDDKLE
jgi:hypothetical protein